MRTALEVVTLYNLEIWNKGRFDLIPELCADRIVRHDANTVTVLELDEQIARIKHNYEELRPTFEPVILAGDDEFITLVWNVTGRDPNWKWCGIEIFRVQHGKIVEVWNSPYVDGRWSQHGALWANVADAQAMLLPTMGMEFTERGADVRVPLDSSGIATWLALAFGGPESTASGDGWWNHRFAPGGQPTTLTLAHAEGAERARVLENVTLDRIEIEWARSGLINAAINLGGTAGPSRDVPVPLPARTTRLAECFGAFASPQGTAGKIVGASIAIEGLASGFAGEVTMRIPAAVDPATICGTGLLEFGWRHEGHELRFCGQADVSSPEGAFEDNGEIEAVFRWRAEHFEAMLRNGNAGQGLRG
ncbi:MAG: hypothetical protein RIS85_2625 [Pseudomonadota bacterium]